MQTPKHLFTCSNGDLCRYDNGKVIRQNYCVCHRDIEDTHELRATLRAGKHLFTCYPRFLMTSDGEALCFDCAREEYRSVSFAVRHKLNDGWRVIACDINYEDASMRCVHCNNCIESAYTDNGEGANDY